ncbi:MAG: hypothetical protein WBB65_01625 [Anaerolineales bacterium]
MWPRKSRMGEWDTNPNFLSPAVYYTAIGDDAAKPWLDSPVNEFETGEIE